MAKTAVFIDRLCPLIQKAAFGFILLGFLALGLKHKEIAGLQTDDEIRPISFYDAFVSVDNFKPQMVVFYPSGHRRVAIQLKGLARFPGAVVNAEVNM